MLKRVIRWLSRRVNFIYDGGSQGKVIRIGMSRGGIAAIGLSLGLFLGLAAFSIASRFQKQLDYEKLAHLEQSNQLLEAQYRQLNTQIDSLKSMLGLLGKHDLQLRVQSNMEVLPADVRELGVGGNPAQDRELVALKQLGSKQHRSASQVSAEVEKLLRKAKYQKKSFAEIEKKLNRDRYLRDHTPSVRPCNGWQCSGFGYRIDPFTKRPRMHNGVDISNVYGTPIIATADGTVSYTGARSGYGLCAKIDHGNQIETFYAHLSSIYVDPGEKVSRGQVIAAMGATGRTTGTHLHYEVRVGGKPVNPLNYIIDQADYSY